MAFVPPTQEYEFFSGSGTQGSTSNSKVIDHGNIIGIEIPVVDMSRAMIFYEDVFKWKFSQYGESRPFHFSSGSITGIFVKVEREDHCRLAYDSCSTTNTKSGDRTNAGGLTFTIKVDNVDDTLIEVEKAKGRVWLSKRPFKDEHPGQDGFVAYILETEQNVIDLRGVEA